MKRSEGGTIEGQSLLVRLGEPGKALDLHAPYASDTLGQFEEEAVVKSGYPAFFCIAPGTHPRRR